MPTLLVTCHPNDRFMTGGYLLHAMLMALKHSRVTLKVQRHWDERPPADLVIPHIDLTVWPETLTDFLAHYPNVVNRRLTDISKRRISRYLVERNDAWDGPVIAKSDSNYGGFIDRKNLAVDAAPAAAAPKPSLPVHHGRYIVYPSIKSVPGFVWKDPAMVVERFLAERKGELYGLRQLMVCDNRFVTRHQWSTDPVVKGESVVERRIIYDPPPPEVRAAIDEHGVDFGKVDFTIVDGRAYVFDIARTPTGPILIKEHPDVIAFLARGLHTLLARKSDRLPDPAQPS